MTDYSAYFDQFCGENHIEIALSYEMPEGYETAFGSFDVVRRTLFLKSARASKCSGARSSVLPLP